ncbi:hypothetical protein MMC16_005467 [Acarospora aff. strigata]|nr:hypothetical protein [Acarospora aff. strigata]
MPLNEKPAAGEIARPAPTANPPQKLHVERSTEDAKSSLTLTPVASQCPTPNEEYDSTSTHPFSAFYCHPTTQTSFEQLKTESNVHIKVYETDLEAGHSRKSVEPSRRSKDCTAMAGKNTLKKKKDNLLCRNKHRWNPMRKLSKKQKLWVKISIALLIVGAAVGLGIGISKAVGAGVWKSTNEQRPIGS